MKPFVIGICDDEMAAVLQIEKIVTDYLEREKKDAQVFLLQNAAEEILRLEKTDRYIRINVEQGKSFLRLEVRNSSKAVFTKNKKLPETQKKIKKIMV